MSKNAFWRSLSHAAPVVVEVSRIRSVTAPYAYSALYSNVMLRLTRQLPASTREASTTPGAQTDSLSAQPSSPSVSVVAEYEFVRLLFRRSYLNH
jgi:hypothetical protein